MLITSSHSAIPANTANVPTEALKNDAAQRPQIPKPPATAENPTAKNSTEFAEQNKAFFETHSANGQDKIESEKNSSEEQQDQSPKEESDNKESELKNVQSTSEQKVNDKELDLEQLKQVQQLQTRDKEVRAHEQAHASVGGSLAGSPNLNFTTGPDGKRYATSGDVSIDVSKVANDPAATIQKLEQVQRAALAPASPSSQDLKVAAQASANVSEARGELNSQRLEEAKTTQEKSNAVKEEEPVEQTTESDNNEQSISLSSSETETFINPVLAKRQSAQLNQKIASSGALDSIGNDIRLSLTA